MIQKTLKQAVRLSGIGIHSGNNIELRLIPSALGELVFRRTDKDDLELRVNLDTVEARNATVLTGNGTKIRTVEHLLASLYIFGINSLVIEINGDEIPILDGSALPFVTAFKKVGTQNLTEKIRPIKIIKPFFIEEKGTSLYFRPDPDFRLTYVIHYNHPLIQRQEYSLMVNKHSFSREIAPARTFGFLKDVLYLQSQGLAKGGSLNNAVVLDDEGVINGPLRFPDEFVRHKILDLIGDISLLGNPLIGYCRAIKAGHELHLNAVRFLYSHSEFWEFADEK
ncbi:MAG: UDP-3-O-[3-hydroxymyristoyl] N-acetylglucosamine deacetylase [Candidatus Aminicenantes bacterium]|nr:UDP-3-O-[3-hydroxymyristoyl] N-acetylglucosamine deacetylase [Candidatus Aminicenantes bacterium]